MMIELEKLKLLLEKAQGYERTRAIEDVANAGERGQVLWPMVAACLGDSDRQVRMTAKRTLRGFGKAGTEYFFSLLRSADGSVREGAARAIGVTPPSGGSVNALAGALGDESRWVREAAAISLGELGAASVDAVPLLMRRLSDEDQYVRASAKDAIASIGPSAAPYLIHWLSDSIQSRKLAAASLLGAIGEGAKEATPWLLAGLEEPGDSLELRLAFLAAIGRIGGVEANDFKKIAVLLEDPEPSVRVMALGTLGQLAPLSLPYLPAIVIILENKEIPWKERYAAALALGELGPSCKDFAVKMLEFLGTGFDWPVKRNILIALGKMKPEDETVITELISLVGERGEADFVREAAARALGKIGPRAAAASTVLERVIRELETDDIISEACKESLGAIWPS